MVNLSKFSPTRKALALLLGMAGLLPAQATVVLGGKTPQENAAREVLAHAAGKKHTSVVGISIVPKGNLFAALMPDLGTGVYLGPSHDGKTGLVLTSAHLFLEEGAQLGHSVPQSVSIFFGPRLEILKEKESLRVPVQRVVLHPKFQYFHGTPAWGPDGKAIPVIMPVNDLALLEFDLTKTGALLAARGVQAAALYEGAGYAKKPLLEAESVGFGLFGTSTTPRLEPLLTVHAGNTRVTYGEFRGRQGFLHVLPLSQAAVTACQAHDSHANTYQFERADKPTTVYTADRRPLPVQSHPNQVLASSGDSGGPIFFNTKDGLRVAGVYSQNLVEYLILPSGTDHGPFAVQFWEPVVHQTGWINGVRKGDLGGAPCIPLGAEERKASSQEAKQETKQDHKAAAPIAKK